MADVIVREVRVRGFDTPARLADGELARANLDAQPRTRDVVARPPGAHRLRHENSERALA